jgi:ubiquinone/menaquinone biosynthesis C-methylase UbiE
MITKNNLLDVGLILQQAPLHNQSLVADLGCGQFGFFVFPLSHLVGKSGKVYAVDVAKGALSDISQRAKLENLPQISVVWSDLEVYGATAIKEEELDGAYLINTLHQADKSLAMLREAIRMIKRQGFLIIVDWKKAHPFGPHGDRLIDRDKLVAAALKSGMILEKEFSPGADHYGLVFRKK